MKACFLPILLLVALITFSANGQGDNNRKPRIVGQDELTTREDESITVQMTDLDVQDRDDWFYPWGFSMQLYPGEHYSLQGNVVIPAADFSGELVVQVTVHDGEESSAPFNLKITVTPVNDRPQITGHAALSTNEGQPVAIQLSDLTVEDPDDRYPEDFTLRLYAGQSYSIDGNRVTPADGFTGRLSVNVRVSDGEAESENYVLPITVNKVNRVPRITGQSTLQVDEDASLTINLSDLTVADEDSNYPQGFSLTVMSGDHYSVSGNTVTPSPDFFGNITVPVTVNDGSNNSKPFDLSVSVRPVNDSPVVADLESEPVILGPADVAVPISETLVVRDVDGDSIMFAKVGIRPEGYDGMADKLVYTGQQTSGITGVFDPATGILSLLGQGSPSRYTEALRNVEFQRMLPAAGQARTLYISVSDGKSESEIVERALIAGSPTVSLEIPTGFTPNGDTVNDTWKIIPLKSEETYATAHIRVYNRQGILVYQSVGFDQEWDGRYNGEPLPADTYFYTIDLNLNAPQGYVKGLVTILR